MAETNNEYKNCYRNYMTLQQQDLEELQNALTSQPHNHSHLQSLTQKTITHFHEYNEKRAKLAKIDASRFFSPSWCSSFESTLLWFGGYRPSLFIRLVHSLTESESEPQLASNLENENKGNMGDISSNQLDLISSLHSNIIKQETKISTRMASLQESLADERLSSLPNGVSESSNRVVDNVLENHVLRVGVILCDADELRFNSLKELMGILTPPLQCVQVLIALMKLQLSIHRSGLQRDSIARRI